MPNAIKYNVSAQTLALKEGDFWIGTGDVSKGPTVNTDYWNGITPPVGGYTIYLGRVGQSPIAYVAANDAELISLTNRIGAQSFTTATECLSWYLTQPDKMVLNKDYEPIVTNGLVFNVDAGFVSSYPRTSTTWYDLSGYGNNGTLINGSSFITTNDGGIVFDGTDDYVTLGTQNLVTTDFSINLWFNSNTTTTKEHFIISLGYSTSPSFLVTLDTNSGSTANLQVYYVSGGVITGRTIINTNTNIQNTSIINLSFTRQSGVNTPYINGVPQTSRIFNESVSLLSSTYVLGWAIPRNKATAYFQGNMYCASIYNRSLSVSEINQNYYATLNSRMIVTNGLVLNLQAGNLRSYPGSGTVWKDVSGNAISSDGILTNGPTFNSSDGGSIVFDGVNDAVIWNSNPLSSLTSAKTYDVWIKFDSSIVNTFTISCGTYMVYLESKNTWYVNQAGASNSFLSWTFSTGWTNFVYSFDGTNHICYINGVARTINFGSGVSSQTNLFIGNRIQMDSPMKGNIATTRMYNRGLSATEILQNYNATKGLFGL